MCSSVCVCVCVSVCVPPQGHKDKQDLLVDCAAVVGLKPSDTAATGQRIPARATSSPSTRDMGGSHVDEDIDDEPVNMASYTSPQVSMGALVAHGCLVHSHVAPAVAYAWPASQRDW